MIEPIKSTEEYLSVFAGLVEEIVKTVGIPKEEAEKRLTRLHKIGILDGLSPESPEFQFMTEVVLFTPSDKEISPEYLFSHNKK